MRSWMVRCEIIQFSYVQKVWLATATVTLPRFISHESRLQKIRISPKKIFTVKIHLYFHFDL